MTIRQKTITVVAAVLIATTCLVYGFSRFFLVRGTQRIELLQITSDLDRILGIVEYAVQSLDTQVADWSAWDDPYQYMQDHNETFVAVNLNYESFTSNKTDLIVLLDTSGKPIVGKSFDFDQEKEAPLPEGLEPYLAEGSPLVRFTSLEGNVAGVVLLKEGPMLVAGRPIITSARQQFKRAREDGGRNAVPSQGAWPKLREPLPVREQSRRHWKGRMT